METVESIHDFWLGANTEDVVLAAESAKLSRGDQALRSQNFDAGYAPFEFFTPL